MACQQFVAGPLVVVQSVAWGTAVSLVVAWSVDSGQLVLLVGWWAW